MQTPDPAIQSRLAELAWADDTFYSAPCASGDGSAAMVRIVHASPPGAAIHVDLTTDDAVEFTPDDAEAFALAILDRVRRIREVTS